MTMMIIKIISTLLILTGTYILSRDLFKGKACRLINFANPEAYKLIHWIIRFALLVFGLKKKLLNHSLFHNENYPTESLPHKEIINILSPFIGYLLVFTGTLLGVFFI